MLKTDKLDHTEKFMRHCRKMGVRVTPQRIAIFRELAESDEHPSADSIFERIREQMPSVSIDTVYRTLSLLEDIDLARNVSTVDGKARYDPTTASHCHFICLECGRIVDVFSDTVKPSGLRKEAKGLGRIDSVSVELHGCCSSCLQKQEQ